MGKTQTHASSVFTMPLFVGIVVAALVLAILSDHSELSLSCALLLTMVAGAKLYSRWSLERLRCTLRVSRRRLFPHETLDVSIDVENAKLLPVWLSVKVPIGAAMQGRKPAGSASLLPFQRASFRWQISPTRRGVHQLGPAELEAADPLGFFRKRSRDADAGTELIVYPRLVPLHPNVLPRRDFFGQRSDTGPVEDPVLITGTRDYQPGRAARFIHWKASARFDRLIEKMCEITEHESVLLVLRAEGFAADPTGEAFERCLEVVASLALQLDQQRCAFGFASNARSIGQAPALLSVARREGQLAQLLEALARVTPAADADVSELVESAGVLAYAVTVVCFTYALDDELTAFGERLKMRRLPLVSVVCQPGSPQLESATLMRVQPLEALRE